VPDVRELPGDARRSVRSLGLPRRRRRLVPAETIEQIDNGSKVIGLRVERNSIRTFL